MYIRQSIIYYPNSSSKSMVKFGSLWIVDRLKPTLHNKIFESLSEHGKLGENGRGWGERSAATCERVKKTMARFHWPMRKALASLHWRVESGPSLRA